MLNSMAEINIPVPCAIETISPDLSHKGTGKPKPLTGIYV